jgi:hypothetical protein
MGRVTGPAALVVGVLILSAPSASAVPGRQVPAVATASALQLSADLGHGEKVSRAASAPGGPVVPEGCRNFGHWVSSEARGTTCADNPRPGRGGKHGDRPGQGEKQGHGRGHGLGSDPGRDG